MGRFDKYQETLRQFNEDFGVNFKYEEFDTAVKQNKYIEANFAAERTTLSVENREYMKNFAKLLPQLPE